MTTLVDFSRLATFTDGDPILAEELAGLFMRTVAGYLDELKAAAGRDEHWSAIAHGLKGACGNFGAVALAELARAAEQQRPDPAMLEALDATFAATRRSLEQGMP